MKGFIEITERGKKRLVAVKDLWIVQEAYDDDHKTRIYIYRGFESYFDAEESYGEVIKRIEEAQKEDGETVAIELAKIVGKKNERKHMIENDCDFCEGGAIRFALKRGGHADDWFDYTRQLTVGDGAINIEVQNELDTEVENIIFEGISYCPFCGKTFQENTEDET